MEFWGGNGVCRSAKRLCQQTKIEAYGITSGSSKPMSYLTTKVKCKLKPFSIKLWTNILRTFKWSVFGID